MQMQNTEMLFEKNDSNHSLKNKIKNHLKIISSKYYYSFTSKIFDGKSVHELICVIKYIMQTRNFKIPIVLDFGNVTFADKLVYVIIETICYYAISKGYRIEILIQPKGDIRTDGISYSPLLALPNVKEFEGKYREEKTKFHFRKLVPSKSMMDEKSLSKIMQEVSVFLLENKIILDVVSSLSEVLIELVGNAIEHGLSDCIIDIDVADNYNKRNEAPNKMYYGLNVVVLNYSDILFYDLLKAKMKGDITKEGRYQFLYEARDYHFKHLSSNYTEDDFYTISSFQHKISGSHEKNGFGGTGLTYLLNSLENYADNNYCYICSSDRVLALKKDYMKQGEKELIGFNVPGNFLTALPDDSLLLKSEAVIPGVAYNLNYAIKEGVRDE